MSGADLKILAGFLVESYMKTSRFNEDLADVQSCITEPTVQNTKQATQAFDTEEEVLATSMMMMTETNEAGHSHPDYDENLALVHITPMNLTL